MFWRLIAGVIQIIGILAQHAHFPAAVSIFNKFAMSTGLAQMKDKPRCNCAVEMISVVGIDFSKSLRKRLAANRSQ